MKKKIITISALVFLSLSAISQDFRIEITQPEILVAFPGSDTLICKGHSIILGGNPTAAGGTMDYIYYWTPFDGLDDPNSANPVASPEVSTKYVLTVTDANGCHVTDFIDIQVDQCLGTGESFIDADISIYPNPSYGSFIIGGLPAQNRGIRVGIINSIGVEVLNRMVYPESGNEEFDLGGEGFPKGVYFLKINTGTRIIIRKIQLI